MRMTIRKGNRTLLPPQEKLESYKILVGETNEGLFLANASYLIGSYHSKAIHVCQII